MQVATNIADANGDLVVAHEQPSSGVGNPSSGVVALTSSDREADTLTRVVSGGLTVYVHWYSQSTVGFSLLRHPETRNLFIGAGSIFAVLAPDGAVLQEASRFMVWGFELLRGYVVEFGEVECALHSPEGRRISEVPVDPPYEIERSPDSITFICDVSGRVSLQIPVA